MVVTLLFQGAPLIQGQQVEGNNLTKVGDIIPDFILRDVQSGELVSREDFSGGILVLDFFAHWCGPCRASTPGLKTHIEEFYQASNGNVYGLPVYVVSINVDSRASQRKATLDYIQKFQLENVLDDLEESSERLVNLFPNNGGIPYFAIVNTLENTPDHNQWELLYFKRGFGVDSIFTNEFQPIIDSISSIQADPEPLFLKSPASIQVNLENPFTLRSHAIGQSPITYQWFKNGIEIPDATNATYHISEALLENAGIYHAEASNSLGTVITDPAVVEIKHSYSDFTQAHALRSVNAEPFSDPDKDGKSNIYEFLMRSKPNDPSDKGIPTFKLSEDGQLIEIIYHINSGAVDVEYSLYSSNDLVQWSEIDSSILVKEEFGSYTAVSISMLISEMNTIFWRIDAKFPKFLGTTMHVGKKVDGEISETDLVNEFYLRTEEETYYEDIYNLSDLVDGREYTFQVHGDAENSYYPWIDVYTDNYSGIRASVGDNDPEPFISAFTFIADENIEYRLALSSFDPEVVGNYSASLMETQTLTNLPFNETREGTLVMGEDDFIHTNYSDSFWMDSLRLEGLPEGKEVSLILETIDEEAWLKAPVLTLENASTRELILSSTDIRLTEAGFTPRTEIRFIPDSFTEYIVTIQSEYEITVGNYTIRVEESDTLPAIRPGDTVQDTVPQDLVWAFDDEEYYIDFHELTDALPDTQLNISISSDNAENVRIFVMNAANWNILFKDQPSAIGAESETSIVPETGRGYLIGAGVPVRDEATNYTLKIAQ